MRFAAPVRSLGFSVVCCLTLILSSYTHAQVRPLINQPVDPAQRQTLTSAQSPRLKSATDLGRADASLPMKDMLLTLRSSSNPAAMQQYVASLHNPNSPNYKKWLTPEQFAAKFGVADADVTTVSAWLQSNGLKVEQVSRGKSWIRFSGTASQVESAFQTEIHKYASTTGADANGTHYANANGISIPAALSPAVAGVVSMSNFFSSPQHTTPQSMVRGANGKMKLVASQSAAPARNSSASPQLTGTNGQELNYIAPGDFAAIYDAQSVVASGINGSGVSIAVVGRSDISISDVEAFRTVSGLPFNDPSVIYATTDPGDVSGDDVEATLDVEWSAAVAPQATINYVIGASTNTTDGVDLASSYIVDNVTAPIMTVSFGACEAEVADSEIAFYHSLWEQAAAEGITVLVAAGDSGSSGCNAPGNPSTVYGFGVNALASTPYNLAVGGTEFNDLAAQSTYWSLTNSGVQSSAKGYIPEAAWNESCAEEIVPGQTNCLFPPGYIYSYAGGGGASSCISRTTDSSGDEWCAAGEPKPAWQTGSGVPKDGVRDLPDVSLAAASEHDPFVFCFQGGCQWTTNSDGSITLDQAGLVGGTSDASPSMASILALVEQKAGTFQGIANYELYSLASKQGSSCNASNRTDPTQPNTCVFNDITLGSNAVPCFNGNQDCGGTDQPVQVGYTLPPAVFPPDSYTTGQDTTTGYDLATGLGSVDVANLVNAWGTLNQVKSTTTLALSKTTFQHGTQITLSGAVTPASGSGKPSGEVVITVSSGNVAVVSISVSSGAYSGTTINLPGGTYTVTATYSGNASYASSASAPVSVTVTPENSVVTGTSYAYSPLRIFGGNILRQTNTAILGYPWFLQFNVAGVSGSNIATGNIKLTVGSTNIGTFPVSSTGEIYVDCGVGTGCDFPIGTVNITASYSGSASLNASTTTYQFNLLGGRAGWATTVNNQTPIANTNAVGYVTFGELVDPSVPPTGTVTLTRSDTGATLGTGKISAAGIATIPFNAGVGTYQLLAQWPGDANYTLGDNYVTTSVQTESNPGTAAVSVSLNVTGSSFTLGQATTYTVTVTPKQKNSATPIGYVDLWTSSGAVSPFAALDGTQPAPQSILLAGGKATGVIHWSTAGPQSLSIVYEGDANFAGANSSTVAATVAKVAPTLAVQTSSSYVAVGATSSATAQVGNPLASVGVASPTGTVQFYDALNGAAAKAIGTPQAIVSGNGGVLLATLATALPTGSNVISATYSGDPNWATVTAATSAPVSVTTPDFQLTAPTGTIAVAVGQSTTISLASQSILGYSTPIAITCGTLPAGVTCNAANITPGTSGSVTLATTAPGMTSNALNRRNDLRNMTPALALAGLLLLFIPRRRKLQYLAMVLLIVGITGSITGCGGGSSSQPTAVTLTSSNTKTASGAAVTFQAAVQSSSSTGTVTFSADGVAMGQPVTIANGAASFTTSSLSVGTHAITAAYSASSGSTSTTSSDTLEQAITGNFTLTITGTSGSDTHSVTLPITLN
jgi:Pro-kumamolisin, activation domain/Bacterial Ig-like domain (group 3)